VLLALRANRSLEAAVLRAISTLRIVRVRADSAAAAAIIRQVRDARGGAVAAALGEAAVHHRRGDLERAWRVLSPVADTALATFAPVIAVDAALATGSPDAHARALAIGAPQTSMSAETRVDLAGRFLLADQRGRAAELIDPIVDRPGVGLDRRHRDSLDLIAAGLGDSTGPTTAQHAAGVPLAVMGYRTPDPAKIFGNIGDHVQTLAMLANIARLSDVAFHGAGGLGAVVGELAGRVREDLQIPGVRGDVELFEVDRDVSSIADVPDGTWMIAFGWHMNSPYRLRRDFPYRAGLRPLFLSFHVDDPAMLDDVTLPYLRRHAPVGCRDWPTVELLEAAGVPAFFTGCLTTTVDAVFPTRSPAEVAAADGVVGLIDAGRSDIGPIVGNVLRYHHRARAFLSLGVVAGVRAADARLREYHRRLGRAVTSRLHAYLPLVALGIPVDFRPPSPGDRRLPGLTGLAPGDARLESMRADIRDLFAGILPPIVEGADERDVARVWRDLTEPRVAAARATLGSR